MKVTVTLAAACNSRSTSADSDHRAVPVYAECGPPLHPVVAKTNGSTSTAPRHPQSTAQLGFSGYDGRTYTTSRGRTYTSDTSPHGRPWEVGEITKIGTKKYVFESTGPRGPGFYLADCSY